MINFGTGGWRAIIGKDFIYDNIARVAKGIVELAKKEGKTDKPIAVGYDRRFLSQGAAKWVAEVLAGGGIDVWLMPRSTPTPLVMHTVKDSELYYGIEITASHNPANYNGIKLIVEEGRDAPLETTQELEQLIADVKEIEKVELDEGIESGKIMYLRNPFNKFLDDILELLDVEALRERGLRVLFDTMHGSGAYPLQVIFHTARCTIDTMNLNKDAWFGGMMPAPSENTLQLLRDGVIRGDYDLGIAMDGDGDRLGIIDHSGRYIDANEILCLLYYYLVKYKGWKGPVVRNLATTHMLDRIAESFGEECYEVPVGFKYISSKIDEVDAVLGGESSGGLTVRGHIHGKDSVYAASLMAEMISVVGKSPSDMIDELTEKFGKFEMVEDNLRFEPEYKATVNDILMVQKKLPDFGKNVVRVNYEDGCKVYFEDDSFVICRFSGTEPLLRIFAESSDKETATSYITAFRKFLNI
ncbi:MAG: phosphoglucomutase/phosphomannomutase family protein [Acutalibacteraceae bacterium]|nr:phosphoglucomutase/phosphomannomutase family protein [Acutalibacteraceae bacterium]